MAQNITEKLISSHLLFGEMEPGREISLKIDQTLTQDALGTLIHMEFEALRMERVQTQLSVSYVDHLTLQEGFENADDHEYLRTVADKYGIVYSKPGNGICHQLHLERFSRPGFTLLGGDSHTPTCGAVGMLAVGAGGLDVAVAMAGSGFRFLYPQIVQVYLHNRLRPWVTAKDVILEILGILTTKGNLGTVLEYGGPGIVGLSVPERAAITNMGAELGVTTSVFPSDEQTREFLRAQNREEAWRPLSADPGATYADTIEIDLDQIEPNIACPHSPDNVVKIKDQPSIAVDQVLIGSCTNASYRDLMMVASLLKGKKTHPGISVGVAAGSRQVLRMIAANGALHDIVEAGARILEPACGFCAGYGQSPRSGAVSVRTNNRNFQGRCGTRDAGVYLVSPESAAACALTGRIADPRELGVDYPRIPMPPSFSVDDSQFMWPTFSEDPFYGPNMGSPPHNTPMHQQLDAKIIIKLGDKITTDHIIPAGSTSKYRSNIEKSSRFVFHGIDPEFPRKCQQFSEQGFSPIILAGESYGQGSSREHAAVCPMHLGVRAVIAKSIERIHMANLVNFGIIPLLLKQETTYDEIDTDDRLRVRDLPEILRQTEFSIFNETKNRKIPVFHRLNPRQLDIVIAGGLLNYIQDQRVDGPLESGK